jgi:hypothetical protein
MTVAGAGVPVGGAAGRGASLEVIADRVGPITLLILAVTTDLVVTVTYPGDGSDGDFATGLASMGCQAGEGGDHRRGCAHHVLVFGRWADSAGGRLVVADPSAASLRTLKGAPEFPDAQWAP